MCKTYKVAGRVQGVFYRVSAREKAQQLNLRGWVKNLPDGQVETYACGQSEQLGEYEQWLKNGPRLAKVLGIDVETSACTQSEGFEIK